MVVLMERVAVEREIGSGLGTIVTRIPKYSNHTWSSGICSEVIVVSLPKLPPSPSFPPPQLPFTPLKYYDIDETKITGIGMHLIGERAKRARHSQVCSIENRGYIYILLEKWFPLWGERAHSLKLFCMYDKRFEI